MRQTTDVMPVEQLVLQGTPFCNLNCKYCDLSEESRRTKGRMPVSMVLTLLRQLNEMKLIAQKLVVVWHSGEPLTLPVSYYKSAMDTILHYCNTETPDVEVTFDFQTNATLIDDQWCDLFDEYASVVNLGVSCDGPENLHNAFRLDWKGRDTFDRTLRGIEFLNRRNIKYNMIAVVSQKTMEHPEPFYKFFVDQRENLTDFHFNVLASPVLGIEDLQYGLEDRSRYTQFYEKLLSLSEQSDKANTPLPVRNYSNTLARIAESERTDKPDLLRQTSAPLRSLNMDYKGNITTFYAGLDIATQANRYGDHQGFSIGNIHRDTLNTMIHSDKFSRMVNDFGQCHDLCAQSCPYYDVCPGGFELIQLQAYGVNGPDTVECVIHVKALIDAVLNHLEV